MDILSKLREELDRAGRVAQGALDEGRLRLEVFRARQAADRAAQELGYAVHRARQEGTELDADSYARLSGPLSAREAEVLRLETEIDALVVRRQSASSSDSTAPVPPPATES